MNVYIFLSVFSQPFDVVATDNGVRQLLSESPTRVTVNVNRNLNSPLFESRDYTVAINRNHRTGGRLITVKAKDEDSSVGHEYCLCYTHMYCFIVHLTWFVTFKLHTSNY